MLCPATALKAKLARGRARNRAKIKFLSVVASTLPSRAVARYRQAFCFCPKPCFCAPVSFFLRPQVAALERRLAELEKATGTNRVDDVRAPLPSRARATYMYSGVPSANTGFRVGGRLQHGERTLPKDMVGFMSELWDKVAMLTPERLSMLEKQASTASQKVRTRTHRHARPRGAPAPPDQAPACPPGRGGKELTLPYRCGRGAAYSCPCPVCPVPVLCSEHDVCAAGKLWRSSRTSRPRPPRSKRRS